MAQARNAPKSALCRIRKFPRGNNKIELEKMLKHSKLKGDAPTILTSEEEAAMAEPLIFAGKRGCAVGEDSLKSLMCRRLLQTADKFENLRET